MDLIRITVKNTAESARSQLVARGIAGSLVSEVARSCGQQYSYWDVPSSARPAVVAWFCEPSVCDMVHGFPPGTLIHHS